MAGLKVNIKCSCGRTLPEALTSTGRMLCTDCDIKLVEAVGGSTVTGAQALATFLKQAVTAWWAEYDGNRLTLPDEIPVEAIAALTQWLREKTKIGSLDVVLVKVWDDGPEVDVVVEGVSLLRFRLTLDVTNRRVLRWFRDVCLGYDPAGAIGFALDADARVLYLAGRNGERAVRVPEGLDVERLSNVLEELRAGGVQQTDS